MERRKKSSVQGREKEKIHCVYPSHIELSEKVTRYTEGEKKKRTHFSIQMFVRKLHELENFSYHST